MKSAAWRGEIVSTRDIFTFTYKGEGRDGFLEGTFEPSRLRPDLAAKAAQYGLEKQLLEFVGITGLHSVKINMTNQIVLLLFAISVVLGLTLLWVRRADRRRQFVQQRLHAITVGKDETKPAPRLSLLRRAASPTAVFQLPRKFRAWLDTAFEATGNRIGLLHLIIAGLIAAIIVILFASRILGLNPVLVMLLGGYGSGSGTSCFYSASRNPATRAVFLMCSRTLLIWSGEPSRPDCRSMRHWQWRDARLPIQLVVNCAVLSIRCKLVFRWSMHAAGI